MKKTLFALGVSALAALLLACGGTAPIVQGDKKLTGTGGAAPAATYSPPATVYSVPSASDFSLEITELSRQCFGSAGCNVTFTVTLKLISGAKFDPAKTYKMVYTVTGPDDTYTNSVEVIGDTYNKQDEEFVSVKSKSTKLTAAITSVIEG